MGAPASFGGWIKLRRKALDLTQDGLARAVGCSLVTIRKLESDERRPSRQIAERLADCLRITPDDLAAFIGMARAEPYLDPAPAAGQAPGPAPARARSNPPMPLTRLIGRKPEVAALRGALLRGDTRLLTLVGPPGIGKTRLALHVAGVLRDAFGDGVYFVDLSAVRDPDLAAAQHTHAAYFLGLAERAATELHGLDQAAWLDRLEAEYPNMRAALSSCLGARDVGLGPSDGEQTAASSVEIGLRLAGALGWFWFVRGSSGEGRRWLDRALDAGLPLLGMTRGIAESLAGLAAVSAWRGQPAAAARLWGAAAALHETEGTPVWPADHREHARYQAIARAQLDADTWEAEWQAGRADPLAQRAARG